MYGVDALAKVVASGTDLYVLSTSEDLSPYKSSRRFDTFFSRRLLAPRNYVVQFVDGLDHSMHAAAGRARAIALLDGHVLTRYAPPPAMAADPPDDPPSDGPLSEHEERG
jgi:hypothetical protein